MFDYCCRSRRHPIYWKEAPSSDTGDQDRNMVVPPETRPVQTYRRSHAASRREDPAISTFRCRDSGSPNSPSPADRPLPIISGPVVQDLDQYKREQHVWNHRRNLISVSRAFHEGNPLSFYALFYFCFFLPSDLLLTEFIQIDPRQIRAKELKYKYHHQG